MPGLDPGIHSVNAQLDEAPMEWIAGSSPAMTRSSVALLLRMLSRPRRRNADLVEPQIEHCPARLLHARPKALRVGTQLVDIDAGRRQLERMPDQPSLHASRVLLHVELQGEHSAVVDAEGLMRGDRGLGEPAGAARQVE